MERAGRRKLLLAGFLSLALCNLLMTITYSIMVRLQILFHTPEMRSKFLTLLYISSPFFSLFSFQAIVPDIRNMQVLVIFFLISAYEVGPGPISWFIAAELFDQSARPIAMAFTSMLNWGGKFLLALLFPPLLVCASLVFSTITRSTQYIHCTIIL